jgi:hypothetical protein
VTKRGRGEARARHCLVSVWLVQARIAVGLVDGHTVPVDATLIRAGVGRRSMVPENAHRVVRENQPEEFQCSRELEPQRKCHHPRKPQVVAAYADEGPLV